MAQGIVNSFGPFYEAIHNNIFEFCKAFQFTPTDQQAELFKILQDESTIPFDQRKKRIAAKSGQGPGKTAASALIGMWRSVRFVDAMTVITAPTLRQAREVYLAECRRHLYKADPFLQKLIKVTKSRVVIGDRPKWGIECATAIKPENVQGYHQDRMTFIIEEASGVARPIIEQILGTLTNPDSLCMAIGNPNFCDCAFYDCFNSQRDEWHTFTFNAEESPIVDQMNVRRLREQFGADSDIYRVRVLGKFRGKTPQLLCQQKISKTVLEQIHTKQLSQEGKECNSVSISLGMVQTNPLSSKEWDTPLLNPRSSTKPIRMMLCSLPSLCKPLQGGLIFKRST